MTVTWRPLSVISVNGRVACLQGTKTNSWNDSRFWPWQLGRYLFCIQSAAQRYSIIHRMLLFGPVRHRQGGVWSDDGERKWWWNGIISHGIKNRSLNWIDLRRSPQFRSSSWSAAWLALKLKSVFKKKNENKIKKETKKVLSPPRQPRHICARTGSRGNCARVSCKLPFPRSAVKQKYINDAQTFFSPHWLAFLFFPPSALP